MKEFLDNLKEAGLQRLRNPFLGTFSALLILFNWRVVMTAVMGELSAADRIAAIEKLGQDGQIWFWTPLVISIAYIPGMPWVSDWAHKVQSKPQSRQRARELQQRLELSALEAEAVTAETIVGLREQIQGLVEEREKLSGLLSDAETKQRTEVESAREQMARQATDLSNARAAAHDAENRAFETRKIIEALEAEVVAFKSELIARDSAIEDFSSRIVVSTAAMKRVAKSLSAALGSQPPASYPKTMKAAVHLLEEAGQHLSQQAQGEEATEPPA